METITINESKYEVGQRMTTETHPDLARNWNLKSNQAALFISKPNGKHIYMVFETTNENGKAYGKVCKIN